MLTWTLCANATAHADAAARPRVSAYGAVSTFVMPSEGHLIKVNLKDGDGLRGVRSSG
jgi:hypothetical protein